MAAACCALACGDRPDPPGAAVSSGDDPRSEAPTGAGSASGGLDRPEDDDVTTPDGMEPSKPADEPAAGVSTDAGVDPADPDDDDDAPPSAARQAVVGCTENGGGCLIFNIAVTDADTDSCIQLALDDCESSPQAGLRVDLPVSWRLGAASISRTSDNCVPGAPYNPMTTSAIVGASGSINWNEDTRAPSEVVLDVTLQPASTAFDTTPIRVTNSDLLDTVLECD